MRAVGGRADTGAVIFPGSKFLESERDTVPVLQSDALAGEGKVRPLRLLFVSRVVAHKGHAHVIELAGYLKTALRRDLIVSFLGRDDPSSGLKGRLQRMAGDLGVEVRFEGEVSNEELHTAYLAADLFICLSEHEGFGMPVFEAMRLGVPVICLRRTALSELMQVHPFALDELDYVRAAAMVRLIDDEAVRARVLSIQASILRTYTRQVIMDQLAAALDGARGHWTGNAACPDANALEDAEIVRSRVNDEVRHGYWPEPGFEQIPREFGENYVTLYDVESYEAMLTSDHGLAGLPDQKSRDDFVSISHREFMSPNGKRLEEGITFAAQQAPGRIHLIYGPYARFPRGFFSVDFEIEAEQSGDPGVVLELEAAAEGEEPVASRAVTVVQIRSEGGLRLLFPVGLEHTIMEFRIGLKVSGNCNFLFRGVTIRNQRQSLAMLPDTPPPQPRRRLSWPKRVSRVVDTKVLSPVAMKHFRKGDSFRDRAWWNDAASAYEAGLCVEPNAFAYLVQLGNCSKEAGCLERSEAAFLKALALRPDDRDANLQIGRLYVLKGDRGAAHTHFLKAIGLERAAAEAMRELGKTGFALEALPDLFG
ncbi:hypothetical protein A8V01_04405 [Novosphingobium guangzhouense]|uniref:Glycosyl transferase family 1 domain-containing protein n=1 Tax=Novosphingobium guangzhouense TaxID=1850347 RepID=A0A2K2G291_9SPHN|nr:hypothetical protein A8V01_04405 [Novosphingobium guangzhouense]